MSVVTISHKDIHIFKRIFFFVFLLCYASMTSVWKQNESLVRLSVDKIKLFLWARAVEPMARVPKMTHGKVSLARGIRCCHIFLYFFCPTSASIL